MVTTTVYAFCYSDCKYESAEATVSLHATKPLAYFAAKQFLFKEWQTQRDFGLSDPLRHSSWSIQPMQVELPQPASQFSEKLLSAYSRALIASLREEIESLHMELSNLGINAKACKYCGAEGGDHKMDCRSIEVRTGPVSEAEKTEEGMRALLEEYGKEIYSGPPYVALALSDLIRSHRHLREVNRQNSDFRRDAFQEAYQRGLESAKKSVSEELYVEVAKLREMTLQELTEFLQG